LRPAAYLPRQSLICGRRNLETMNATPWKALDESAGPKAEVCTHIECDGVIGPAHPPVGVEHEPFAIVGQTIVVFIVVRA
jgi:hypothetical protein